MGDVFKFSASSGEWTFVAGSTTSSASPTMDQGMGVPIAGNFSGPGSRVQPSWSAHAQPQPQHGELCNSKWKCAGQVDDA